MGVVEGHVGGAGGGAGEQEVFATGENAEKR